jgi:hypothetical protein
MQQHKEDSQPPTELRAGADPNKSDRATGDFDLANDRLLNLLEIWEERYVRGLEFSAESLAVDDPTLLQALKSQISGDTMLISCSLVAAAFDLSSRPPHRTSAHKRRTREPRLASVGGYHAHSSTPNRSPAL